MAFQKALLHPWNFLLFLFLGGKPAALPEVKTSPLEANSWLENAF